MALYTTTHLHDAPPGREDDYARWFDGPHQEALGRLRGFRSAERYEVTPEQAMAEIPQPWRYLSVYDFDLPDPQIDVPALGPLLAEARDAGLIDDSRRSERIYTWALRTDWVGSDNWNRAEPFSGLFIILGNYTIGMETEYHRWYEQTHVAEVTACPGHVAMRRGYLAETQIEPKRFCPGDQLVMCAHQTDDLAFTVREFSARAGGRSPSGIAMAPRSKAGSVARTVHYFRKISGARSWSGGVAYAGDRSVYPELGGR